MGLLSRTGALGPLFRKVLPKICWWVVPGEQARPLEGWGADRQHWARPLTTDGAPRFPLAPLGQAGVGEDPRAEIGQGPGRKRGGRGKGWPYARVEARTTMVQGSGGACLSLLSGLQGGTEDP